MPVECWIRSGSTSLTWPLPPEAFCWAPGDRPRAMCHNRGDAGPPLNARVGARGRRPRCHRLPRIQLPAIGARNGLSMVAHSAPDGAGHLHRRAPPVISAAPRLPELGSAMARRHPQGLGRRRDHARWPHGQRAPPRGARQLRHGARPARGLHDVVVALRRPADHRLGGAAHGMALRARASRPEPRLPVLAGWLVGVFYQE